MEQSYNWYKENPDDQIWWLKTAHKGVWCFSFDRKQIFNMFADYPDKLTPEQVAIFDAENPYWAEYLRGEDE